MQEKNLSIIDLTRSAGVSPTTVENILNGASRNPRTVTIKMIYNNFGVSLVEFFDAKEFRELG